MIEKKSEVSYGSLMKDLKARNFSPIYILEGDESFYIDKIFTQSFYRVLYDNKIFCDNRKKKKKEIPNSLWAGTVWDKFLEYLDPQLFWRNSLVHYALWFWLCSWEVFHFPLPSRTPLRTIMGSKPLLRALKLFQIMYCFDISYQRFST